MYPSLPYPGFSWSMHHHWGPLNKTTLYPLLWAGATFARTDDPVGEINNYLGNNNILTRNIRSDSGQVDTWRDYQQVLSELGLIFSTETQRIITPTPLGLAYLDETVSFVEVVTMQALRYQYPNGHRTGISPRLRSEIKNTKFQYARSLTELQVATEVQIRPAVLIWQVLRQLQRRHEEAVLTRDEVQTYLLPCKSHADTKRVIQALLRARNNGIVLPLPTHTQRDIQEWFRFLLKTPLFEGATTNNPRLEISHYGNEYAGEIDEICVELVRDETFWKPNTLMVTEADRLGWYAKYGAIDLGVNAIPEFSENELEADSISEDEDERLSSNAIIGEINLRDFAPSSFKSADQEYGGGTGTTIYSSYDAGLSDRQHRLHDLMVILIGNTCRQNGAKVFDDPSTVDLLVLYEEIEFLIEVKSVTSRNLVKRVRYALGQLFQYDYMRSKQSKVIRRKVVALAAQLDQAHWCVPFLNTHLDMDLLTMQGEGLKVDSSLHIVHKLFTPTNVTA